MNAGGGVLTSSTIRLVCLTSCFALRAYQRHGYPITPGLALAAFAAYRTSFLKNAGGAESYASEALAWTARLPHPLYSHRVEYVVQSLVYGWTRPRRSTLAPLQSVIDSARETGDLQYVEYAHLQRTSSLALAGGHLAEVQRELELVYRYSPIDIAPHVAAVRLMRAGPSESGELSEALEALRSPLDAGRVALLSPWVFWLEILCMLGGWARAWRIVRELGRSPYDVGSTLSQLVDFMYLRGVAAAVSAHPLRARFELARSLRRVRIWAQDGIDFVHMVRGLEAEREWLRGRSSAALQLYGDAAQRAEQREYVHHAALLHERRAALLERLHRDTESAAALERAEALYDAWGANTKVVQLQQLRLRVTWKR